LLLAVEHSNLICDENWLDGCLSAQTESVIAVTEDLNDPENQSD